MDTFAVLSPLPGWLPRCRVYHVCNPRLLHVCLPQPCDRERQSHGVLFWDRGCDLYRFRCGVALDLGTAGGYGEVVRREGEVLKPRSRERRGWERGGGG